MVGRKLVVFLGIAAMILCVANVALAENRIELKVTDEPVRYEATCDKAGSFSFEWDENTVIRTGDRMYFDTDYVNDGKQVQICRPIDIIVAPAAWDGTGLPPAWSNNVGEQPGVNGTATVPAPVYYKGTTALFQNVISEGIVFHIYTDFESAGGTLWRRVWIDVLSGTDPNDITLTDAVQVGPVDNDRLVLQFFDQLTNIDYATDGIYETTYNNAGQISGWTDTATVEDNTLCIALKGTGFVWNHQEDTQAHMDSKNDKYTFIPSDPVIAHILPTVGYSWYTCEKQDCGNIPIGTGGPQQVGTCQYFDNEDEDYNGAGGYCINTHRNNQMIIQKASGYFDNTVQYQVQARILVGTSETTATMDEDNGVYFSNVGFSVGGYTSGANACVGATQIALGGIYYRETGAVATPEAAHMNQCDMGSNAARAVRWVSNASTLGFGATDDFLYIDLPSFNYDQSLVAEGETVFIEITLTQYPCGELFKDTACIGTFGCVTATDYATLVYPYMPPYTTNYFTGGFVVTNLGNTAGNVVVFYYESDGDSFQINIPTTVNAHSVYVSNVELLSQMSGTVLTNTGGGELGDAGGYMVVCTNFLSDGFALLTNPATGEGTGYLPRHRDDDPQAVYIGTQVSPCEGL